MKKLAKLTAFALILALAFSVAAVGGCGNKEDSSSATLNDWSAPAYEAAKQGDDIIIKSALALDSDGEAHPATVTALDPENGAATISGSILKAEKIGTYTLIYTINFNGKKHTKTSSISVSAKTPDDPGPDDPGEKDKVLGALKVIEGSEQYFTVSGNTVTVLKKSAASDWKTIGWDLTGWTVANGKNISIKVTNNTSGLLDVKYKATVDGGEQYGYPDLDIAAGANETYAGLTATKNATDPKAVTKIELAIGSVAGSGTITIEAALSGSTDDPAADPVLGQLLVIDGSEQYFTVSGNTVTVLKKCAASDWKTIGWDLTGWTLAAGKNISIKVTNNTSGLLDVKYKATVDGGEQYGYPDLAIAAGANKTYAGVTAHEAANPKAVTRIELAIGSAAGSGTFTVEAKLLGTEGGGDETGATLSAIAVTDGSQEFMSVSGDTVTIKKAVSLDGYKGLFCTVSGYDKTKVSNITVNVTNSTGKVLKLKYKIVTDNGASYGYPDPEIAAGASHNYFNSLVRDDVPSYTTVTKIEVFVGTEAASGTFTIRISLS